MSLLWNAHIQKQYKNNLEAFSLDVTIQSDAKSLVLFGPSGAGKSQILKMLSGLVSPDGGFIEFNGNSFFNKKLGVEQTPQQRGLSFVFQDYALFPHLTVYQNIAFSLNKAWFNKGNRFTHKEVDEWVNKLELNHLVQQYPYQLSGGQSQRVALARALVSKPRGLLLDEPFAALDSHLRQSLREELRSLHIQLNIPMILISHDEKDVDIFGDQVIAIEHGRNV